MEYQILCVSELVLDELESHRIVEDAQNYLLSVSLAQGKGVPAMIKGDQLPNHHAVLDSHK